MSGRNAWRNANSAASRLNLLHWNAKRIYDAPQLTVVHAEFAM